MVLTIFFIKSMVVEILTFMGSRGPLIICSVKYDSVDGDNHIIFSSSIKVTKCHFINLAHTGEGGALIIQYKLNLFSIYQLHWHVYSKYK